MIKGWRILFRDFIFITCNMKYESYNRVGSRLRHEAFHMQHGYKNVQSFPPWHSRSTPSSLKAFHPLPRAAFSPHCLDNGNPLTPDSPASPSAIFPFKCMCVLVPHLHVFCSRKGTTSNWVNDFSEFTCARGPVSYKAQCCRQYYEQKLCRSNIGDRYSTMISQRTFSVPQHYGNEPGRH